MKTIKFISTALILLNFFSAAAQNDSSRSAARIIDNLSIEPAIGINPMPISDLVFSNLIQWNVKKRLSIISHTSYSANSAFLREFNYIKTNYNFGISQKLGIGTSVYGKHSSHTFSFLAGIKYNAYKETLENPDFEKASASASVLSPDMGLMYNLKLGKHKYFFSYRMYIPLYPYPFKTTDIFAIDGNMANIAIEFGLGIRIR